MLVTFPLDNCLDSVEQQYLFKGHTAKVLLADIDSARHIYVSWFFKRPNAIASTGPSMELVHFRHSRSSDQ